MLMMPLLGSGKRLIALLRPAYCFVALLRLMLRRFAPLFALLLRDMLPPTAQGGCSACVVHVGRLSVFSK